MFVLARPGGGLAGLLVPGAGVPPRGRLDPRVRGPRLRGGGRCRVSRGPRARAPRAPRTTVPSGRRPARPPLFQTLYAAAQAGTSPPTRFLSRFDKSATNMKESELWVAIGQVPWAIPYSTWYHVFLDFPIQALEAAATLGQYTLTDWGTWLSA